VYVGCCGSELHAQWLSDINAITGYEQTGCTLSMFANRLSFFFDFKGPSKAVDTGARRAARPRPPAAPTAEPAGCSTCAVQQGARSRCPKHRLWWYWSCQTCRG